MTKTGFRYSKIIHLSDGVEIIVYTVKYGDVSVFVDKEDLERVSKIGWSITKPKKTFYAKANIKRANGQRAVKSGLHQFVLNFPKHSIIDHKDGNGLNNRKSNLRLANSSQSGANTRLHKDSKTGFKGVTFISDKNLYKVQVRKDNKLVYWKQFKNPLLAAAKYNEIALKHFGEFACLNEFSERQLQEIKNPPIETRRISKNNISGYMGVSARKNGYGKKYIATIYHEGKNKFLGTFKTPEAAAIAYNESAIKYRGANASLNVIK